MSDRVFDISKIRIAQDGELTLSDSDLELLESHLDTTRIVAGGSDPIDCDTTNSDRGEPPTSNGFCGNDFCGSGGSSGSGWWLPNSTACSNGISCTSTTNGGTCTNSAGSGTSANSNCTNGSTTGCGGSTNAGGC